MHKQLLMDHKRTLPKYVKTTNDEIVRIISINLIILRFIYFSGAYQLITYINKKRKYNDRKKFPAHPSEI